MFYLKHKGEKLNIGDDNVFTTCPICGKEHAVDLHELLAGGEADLFGTAVYCPACAERRFRDRKTAQSSKQEMARPTGRVRPFR